MLGLARHGLNTSTQRHAVILSLATALQAKKDLVNDEPIAFKITKP